MILVRGVLFNLLGAVSAAFLPPNLTPQPYSPERFVGSLSSGMFVRGTKAYWGILEDPFSRILMLMVFWHPVYSIPVPCDGYLP